MNSCDRCKEAPVIFLRYSGQHLCGLHFLELLKRRIKKEMRSQGTIWKRDRIGVALSGGKDSVLALRTISEIVGDSRDKEIVALTIDEGIAGYRGSSIDICKDITEDLGVQWELSSFRELFGMDLDEMVKRSNIGPCTICGILRRHALNTAAKRAEVDIMVTGHNLDDMSQTILMNVMAADLKRLARLGPHFNPISGFIPRSMPLRTTPETETYLASLLLGLPIHEPECPYARTAKRGEFRDLLLKAEENTPGTRHSLLRFQEQVTPLIPKNGVNTIPCRKCGEPVVNPYGDPLCKTCELLHELGVHN
ncbi:MAG: ATP-binding protein [Thermoplasmatota archaeon]